METMYSGFANMTDGPGMQDQGLLKLKKISGVWKTEDGSFEMRIRSQEAVAVLRGRGALETRISVNNMMTGMMGMAQAMGTRPAPHEIDLLFCFGTAILDVEGNLLLRLERAWYENETLTVEATDGQTGEKRMLKLFRVPREEEPVDPSVRVPNFCPECGHPMEGRPVCRMCGWRVRG